MGTQAIEVARFGGPEVLALSSIPEPVAGPGQAVISVAAADVLFLDATIRSGRAAAGSRSGRLTCPAAGVGGRVTAAGAGVDPAWAWPVESPAPGRPGGQAAMRSRPWWPRAGW